MKAARLHERDRRRSKRIWGNEGAFTAPRIPTPHSTPEIVARQVAKNHIDHAVTVHIYTVLELLEEAYRRGVTDGRRK